MSAAPKNMDPRSEPRKARLCLKKLLSRKACFSENCIPPLYLLIEGYRGSINFVDPRSSRGSQGYE
jgi:hypothetical protein